MGLGKRERGCVTGLGANRGPLRRGRDERRNSKNRLARISRAPQRRVASTYPDGKPPRCDAPPRSREREVYTTLPARSQKDEKRRCCFSGCRTARTLRNRAYLIRRRTTRAARTTLWPEVLRLADTTLITGGAGFIGRYVARALLAEGHRVRVLDSLIEQVHGGRGRPDELDPEVELVVGDVRDEAAVRRSLAGVDKVVHLAAEVGVGQSMYAVDRYVSVNDHGTAVLFQQLIERPVKRVV